MTARDARGRFVSTPPPPREPVDFPATGSRGIHPAAWVALGAAAGWLIAAIAMAVGR